MKPTAIAFTAGVITVGLFAAEQPKPKTYQSNEFTPASRARIAEHEAYEKALNERIASLTNQYANCAIVNAINITKVPAPPAPVPEEAKEAPSATTIAPLPTYMNPTPTAPGK